MTTEGKPVELLRDRQGVYGIGVLVETLLERGADGDLVEAQEAIGWLANLPADEGWAIRKITLLRLRALLARARGDDGRWTTRAATPAGLAGPADRAGTGR